MRAIDRKLLRDLARMWAQAVTIAMVLACGIASFVTMRGVHASIVYERDAFYSDQRFGDVFIHLERAPEAIAQRIEQIEGVARVETRISDAALVPIEGLTEPAIGRIVSLPSHGAPAFDVPLVRAGRVVEPGRADEALVLESFAKAHHIGPGDHFDVVLNGKLRRIRVVGLAMSPEYVFAVGGGSFINDPARFGVLWMDRDAIAPAFNMEGSFNDVVLSLQPGADERAVLADVERVLLPYGVVSATGRARQLSNLVLEQELTQLRSYAIVAPAIFLGVAAFLINVVLSRTLALQRSQIATLKALGYTNFEIGTHYLELVALILLGGALLGIGLGGFLGRGMIGLYQPFFRFPHLVFRFDLTTLVAAVGVSLAAGFAGAILAVVRAVRIPPAEAMLPETPAVYRRPLIERLGIPRVLGVAGRMVLREMLRRPLRAFLSCFAIALATAVVVTGRFADDAITVLFDVVFERAQHDDLEVSFNRPVSARATAEIAALPGVLQAQGQRAVVVRVRHDQRYRDVAMMAHADLAAPLRDVAVWPMKTFRAPVRGVAMSRKLADVLGVEPGMPVTVELLEGDRRKVDVTVTALVDDIFGMSVHASDAEVRRLVGEEANVTSVALVVDPTSEALLMRRLSEMPVVTAITRRSEIVQKFHEQTEYMWITMLILTGMGATIAFGVVYNQARIALSTRSRDLASLRVLGFTRREISAVLLGELGAYVVLGVPPGLLLGRWLMKLIMSTADPESYRMPAYASASTFAFATTVTVIAALASALVVRRRLDRLDLVSVLKARE